MNYSSICSCQIQEAFKKQLFRIIALNMLRPDSDQGIHQVIKETNDFINGWCPVAKNCPCKEGINYEK